MKNIKKLGRLLTVLTLSIILAISASNILADHVETDTTIKEDKLIEETNTLTQESVDQESDELDLNSEETKTKNNLKSDSDELNDINKLQSNQPDDINIQAD